MVKSACCKEVGLKKGPWKPEEDQKLLAYIERHGHGSWRTLPAKAGLQRCGKSCRLRWTNYLRPDIRRGKFSLQEEQTIIQLHALLGNRWSAIAGQLSKRTDNEIKNYWNTHLKKRLIKMGIDPMTHKPRTNALVGSADGRSQEEGVNANLNHIAQWESARVEAEARLVKESKLLSSKYLYNLHPHHNHNHNHPPIPFPPSKQPMLPCLDILKAWQGVVWTNHTNNNHAGTLESPTSVLHVSDNVLISSACGATNTFSSSRATSNLGLHNLRSTDIMTKKNYSDPQNNEHDVMLLHGIINDGSFPVDALSPCIPGATASMCDDNDLLPSFPEEVLVTADDHDLLLSDDVAGIFSGMTGIYVDGSSSSSGGNLEDNNKYWNY